MVASLPRIFLDTNIYILGSENSQSDEGLILTWLGFQKKISDAHDEIIVSQELIDQITCVARDYATRIGAVRFSGKFSKI